MKEKKPLHKSKIRPPKQEDIAVWGQATEDVTKLGASNKVPPAAPKRPKTPKGQHHQNVPDTITLESFATSIAINQSSSFQIDAALRKKFEKGDLPIDGKIDLHGLTLAQAHHQFIQFITRKIKEGARFILVVTGKGLGDSTENRGVIRKNLPIWCEDANLKPHILRTQPAQAKHGGSGTTYILLRKLKN